MSDIVNSRLINELSDEDILIYKTIEDIINDIDYKDPQDAIVCKDIITHLEKNIAVELKNKKAVSLPYVGVLRDNPVIRAMQRHRLELKLARKQMDKDNYVEYAKEVFRSERRKINDEIKEKRYVQKFKRNNKKKYMQLLLTLGKTYADTYMYALSLLKEVEFNQEVQDHYDELNNRKSDNNRRNRFTESSKY